MNLGNTKDEFLLMLAKRVNGYQYWLDYFGVVEFFGPNWSLISAAFCFWNSDFCRTASAFEELQAQSLWDSNDIDVSTSFAINSASTK